MFVLVSTQVGRNFHSQGRGIEKKIFAWIEINVIPAEKKYFSLVDDLFMRERFFPLNSKARIIDFGRKILRHV